MINEQNTGKCYITILLFVIKGKEDVFNEYEEKVLPLLSRHQGQLLYRIRPEAQQYITPQDEYPYEIHIVSFETITGFEQYKADKDRQSHAYLFRESVSKTLMIEGFVR